MPSQPLPDVNNVVMIQFKGTVGGQPFMHVLHAMHDESTPNQADVDQFATELNTTWGTQMRPIQHNSTILTQVVVTSLKSRTGVVGISTVTQTGTGGATGAANNIAYAVGWSIARRYRGGHPRTYHTGLRVGDITNPTQILSTSRTAILNAWNAVRIGINTPPKASMPNLRLVQVSYYSGHTIDGNGNRIPTLRPTPVVDLITGVKGDNRLDSQRKRLGRPS